MKQAIFKTNISGNISSNINKELKQREQRWTLLELEFKKRGDEKGLLLIQKLSSKKILTNIMNIFKEQHNNNKSII